MFSLLCTQISLRPNKNCAKQLKFVVNMLRPRIDFYSRNICFGLVMIVFISLSILYFLQFEEFRMSKENPQQRGWWRDYHQASLWDQVPTLELYVRFTNNGGWAKDFEHWLMRSVDLFWPEEYRNLTVVLDGWKASDHEFGRYVLSKWPRQVNVCYRDQMDPKVYHNDGHNQMYLDMMHADTCIRSEYVGFVDTDSMFVTVITPNLLFENKKPIVVGRIGRPVRPCWLVTAAYILGHTQVMQCMSYFPVIFKVEHIIKMRRHVELYHRKAFMEVFREAPSKTKTTIYCYCHFSIMCNYVWYYHRDEYAFHLQMIPNENWKKEGWISSMVTREYYDQNVSSSEKAPIPRTSIHTRHIIYQGKHFEKVKPEESVLTKLLKEGICYSAGFKYCPSKCKMFNESLIHSGLYKFEVYDWTWDDRCMALQKAHYDQGIRLLLSYEKRGKSVFGLKTLKEICSLL